MTLFETITSFYPELKSSDFRPDTGIILLQDDSDGLGAYIAKWDYSKPIPEGLSLGKP
jgi:hypothetical protein